MVTGRRGGFESQRGTASLGYGVSRLTPAHTAGGPCQSSASEEHHTYSGARAICCDICANASCPVAAVNPTRLGWKPCATAYRCSPPQPSSTSLLTYLPRYLAASRDSSSQPDPAGKSPSNLMCTKPRPHADSIADRLMWRPTAKCRWSP